MLLNLYVEWAFLEAFRDLGVGIEVNGRTVNKIRYADDTVLIVGNPHDLQIMLDAVKAKGKEAGLQTNGDKNKLVVVCREESECSHYKLTIGPLREFRNSNTLVPW